MSFEDYKDAWLNSEVMQLFEKIAIQEGILDGPDPDLYSPVDFDKKEVEEEGKDWEDEVENQEEALEEATNEFIEPEVKTEPEPKKEEIQTEYEKALANELQSLASDLAEKGYVAAAYRIENTILKIKFGRSK